MGGLTDTPKRIRLQRSKGWRKPAGTIVVARPSMWGNPFVVEQTAPDRWAVFFAKPGFRFSIHSSAVAAQQTAVDLHRLWIEAKIDDPSGVTTKALSALKGHDLACWCKEGTPCHADTLIELANR